jgi:hypothetical protein
LIDRNLERNASYEVQNLEKLCLVYIRPIFEYACEIWDNCGVCYSTKLEQLQLDAARIVTGLPIFTKTDKLYSETGWTTLSSRRHNRKLQLFYNITLKIIFSMWLFHLESLDKVTPKCLWLIVIGILFPLNVKLKLYLTSVLENNIISVLSGLKDIKYISFSCIWCLPLAIDSLCKGQ